MKKGLTFFAIIAAIGAAAVAFFAIKKKREEALCDCDMDDFDDDELFGDCDCCDCCGSDDATDEEAASDETEAGE